MALVACGECGKQVSDTAASCPNCGAPIAGAAEAIASGSHLTTTQGTSKRLKLHSLLAAVAISVGVVMMMGADREDPSVVGGLLVLGGIIWFITTRARIWWHHS